MQCRSCGIELPGGAAHCPACGVATPYKVSDPGVSSDDLTVASSPSDALLYAPPPPASEYGLPFSRVPQLNPYEPLDPYGVPGPPPPPIHLRGLSTGMTALLIVLALLVIGGSTILYSRGVLQSHQLHAQATATAPALQTTAAAIANTPQGLYNSVIRSSPVLDDPLRTNDTNHWTEYTSTKGNCLFTDASYHAITQLKDRNMPCFAQATDFRNFTYQIQMTIIKGEFGGIIFRAADAAHFKYYRFVIDENRHYSLTMFGDSTGEHDQLLRTGSSSFIKPDLNQSNLLAVVAHSNDFSLYINNLYITSVSDSTYRSGQIGVVGGNYVVGTTDVMFRNARVWN